MSRPPLKKQLAFPLLTTAVVGLTLYLLHAFDSTFKAFFSSLPGMIAPDYDHVLKLVQAALYISLTFVLVRAANELIFGFVVPKRKGYEAPGLARDIFSLIAYVLVFALILKWFFPNITFGTLFTTSAVVGVILGLALQDTLGNLFSGISLQADKPFQVGDVISVGKWTGVVESITWRAVKIRTFQNHIILVSNSNISKESIEVCPRNNLNARVVTFHARYIDSPARVINIVREAVREGDNISQKIKPIVRIKSLDESGVEYELKYYLDNYARFNDTDALIRQRIWYAFQRAGLGFPFPTRTLHIARDGKTPSLHADEHNRFERLAGVSIFAPLSQEELISLAADSETHVFAPGESIIRAGDAGASMFVLHRGSVRVQVSTNGKPRTLATLKEGDFFGEMALLTGEPRTANVIAAEETEVLEIGYEAMRRLFETNPDLVEALSRTIAERRVALTSEPEKAAKSDERSVSIVAAIKRFFHLD
jgi:small-conductance mechanosensitive channel